jgi:outer membrane protein assembly factor BamB
MEKMKSQLAAEPDNEQLKGQIRDFDEAVRHSYFKGRSFAARGAWLMLAGSIVLIVSLKLGSKFGAVQYIPDPNSTARASQAHMASLSRQAIGGFTALTAGVLIALAAMPRYQLPAFTELATGQAAVAVAPTVPVVAPVPALPSREQYMKNWPAFRGPLGTGVAGVGGEYPTDWDVSGKNVLWKVDVPTPGNGAPIVWEDKVFLAGGNSNKREVMCFDAATGKLLWEQQVGPNGAGKLEVTKDTGIAPSTPATDGRLVYAIFPTGDLAALDLAGRIVWSKALGLPKNDYGHGSSLMTWEGKLIVQLDQGHDPDQTNSWIYAYDGATGQVLWKTKREKMVNSWSTPMVALLDKGAQIVVNGNPWVCGYDPASGKELWRANLMNGELAPSPAFDNGVAYVCNSGAVLAAIKLDGTGDVTKSHVLWTTEDNLPDISSPVAGNGLVWMITSSGHIACQDGKNGKLAWEKDLDVDVKASPCLVGKNIYLMDCKGVMHIFADGREDKPVAQPSLGVKEKVEGKPSPEFFATPAFAAGRIFIRSTMEVDDGVFKDTLYCVGAKP